MEMKRAIRVERGYEKSTTRLNRTLCFIPVILLPITFGCERTYRCETHAAAPKANAQVVGTTMPSAPGKWAGDLTSIDPHDWNSRLAGHLLNRAGFGGTPEELHPDRRAAVVSFLSGELGSGELHYADPALAKALRRTLHLILGAPEYQVN